MTNGLMWAVLGLGVGLLVNQIIENKYNNKKYLFIVLLIALVAFIAALKFGLLGDLTL